MKTQKTLSSYSPMADVKSDKVRLQSIYPLKKVLLPNVREFKVKGVKKDKYAAVFNLERITDRKTTSKKLAGESGNRYLRRSFLQLTRYAMNKNVQAFQTLAIVLLSRSISYRISCLFHVEERWYKEKDLRVIAKAMKLCDKLARKWTKGLKTPYEFKRVNIPKPDGSTRPLAVPELCWRIWANMLYKIVWTWLGSYYPSWQHGARPKKGVLSCWSELWEKINSNHCKYVYEFDLTRFFDTIGLDALQYALEEVGMNDTWVQGIMGVVENPKSNLSALESREEFDTLVGRLPYGEVLTRQWDCETSDDAHMGVPQGLSLSPLLACGVLANETTRLKKGTDLLMYMDDGILISEKPLEKDLEQFSNCVEMAGSCINENKSKYFMKEGVSEGTLKFLGMELYKDSKGYNLRANTRSGVRTEFPSISEDALMELNDAKFKTYLESNGPISTSIKYGVFGAIVSKMWNPQGDVKYVGDHLLLPKKGSLGLLYEYKLNQIGGVKTTKVNISSKASLLLASLVGKWNKRARPKRLCRKLNKLINY